MYCLGVQKRKMTRHENDFYLCFPILINNVYADNAKNGVFDLCVYICVNVYEVFVYVRHKL